jgi:threonine/homoserine/homoserine lactone efflux protein
MSHYLVFMSTALICVAIPGPDFLLVFQTALRAGKRSGLFSAIGIAAGLVVHGTFATLGLSALLLKSARAFEIVKWAGAAYLIYLAVQLIIDLVRTRNSDEVEKEIEVVANTSAKKYIMRGFLTNVLNIKAALYFVAIVPQFIQGSHHVSAQLAILSIIQIFVALAWFSLLAVSVNKLGVFLKRRIVQRWLDGATAAIFIGLAGKLATTHRN